MNDQLLIVVGGFSTAVLTGATAWISKRSKSKMEQGIKPHLETLSDRVSKIEGRLGGIEETQRIMLERLIQNGK